MIDPEQLMRLAIEAARRGIAHGQSPFGCAIARGDDVLAVAHNTVLADYDCTAHAETNALRLACRRAQAIYIPGAVLATTCEPCPMCMAAIHWGRIDTVFYGATIDDAGAAGFRELSLPAVDLVRLGNSPVTLVGELLAGECRQLFSAWRLQPGRIAY